MTGLQIKALETAKELIRTAYISLSNEATNPAEFARTGTFTNGLCSNLGNAEDWLKEVLRDEDEE